MKKVLVYSHDTFGLGNIRRMLEISRHLVDADPEVSVLIVSGSPMLHAFRIPPRIDYIKLPCLARDVQGDYHVKYLDLGFDDTLRLRSNLLVSAVLDFEPDLIMVDKKPFGVANELAAALTLLQRRGARTRTVLLLRDILDAQEPTTRVWRKNGYHDAIRQFYQHVLVVGTPEIFDLVQEYRFPASTAERLLYCGYLRRPAGVRSRAAIRGELGVGDSPLVLVTAGGGEDGGELIAGYLRGLGTPAAPAGAHSLVVCGPEMAESRRREVHALAARRADVTVRDFSDDMMGCMDAADLVVSMGGYNTICEILTLRKRAIIVPRTRPVSEQAIRAERMAGLGLLRCVSPDGLAPGTLQRVVAEELSCANVRARGLYQIDLDGLTRIGTVVGQLLEREGRPRSAAARAQRVRS